MSNGDLEEKRFVMIIEQQENSSNNEIKMEKIFQVKLTHYDKGKNN